MGVLKTTEGTTECNKAPITTKICRVLEVLRQYIGDWPFPRSPSDALALNLSWRGKPMKFNLKFQNKPYEVDLHRNATVGQIAEAVKNQAHLNKNYFVQLFTEENDAHVLDTELLAINAYPQNSQLHFIAKVSGNHAKMAPRKMSPRPDRCLVDYPEFLSSLLELFDMALDIQSQKMVSSIQKLLLLLPCDCENLRNSILDRSNLEPFFESTSWAQNWYNMLLLRVVLMPSKDEDINADLVQNFFVTNGPLFVLKALYKFINFLYLSDAETKVEFIESIFELARYVSLVMMCQDIESRTRFL